MRLRWPWLVVNHLKYDVLSTPVDFRFLTELRPHPALRIGVVSCPSDPLAAELFFPGRCPLAGQVGANVVLGIPGRDNVPTKAESLGALFNEGVDAAHFTLAHKLGWQNGSYTA